MASPCCLLRNVHTQQNTLAAPFKLLLIHRTFFKHARTKVGSWAGRKYGPLSWWLGVW